MSEVEGQTQEPEKVLEPSVEEVKQVSPEELDALVAKVSQLTATNQRLLEESKTYKGKYRETKDSVDNAEREMLEKEGKLSELLELERNKAHELKGELETFKRQSMKSSLQVEVSKYAKDAHSLDDIFSTLPKEVINYNEASLQFEGVKDAVERLRQDKPYLFAANVVPSMATGKAQVTIEKPKTVDELIKEDPFAALGQLVKEGHI